MSQEIDELLDAIDIEWVLDREAVDYKHTVGHQGEQLNVRECPVCHGDTFKVYVNRENGLGNCFHGDCQATFNKFSFIRAVLGGASKMQMREYLGRVAKEFGWRPPRRTSVAVEMDTAWKMPDSFALPHDGQNLQYLEERGFHAELVAYFHWRLCWEGWFNFTKPDGSKGGQKFDQRVIIPVFDLDGSLVTFQGRDITGENGRKYLFPSGLPGTGRFLYNGHNAMGAKRVVVGEGAFDVAAIKLAVDGYNDHRDMVPVGTFGMHLSGGNGDGNDQLGRFLQLKKHGLRQVYIMWDGEKKALKKAMRAGLELRKLGFQVLVCLLPQNKDPNEVDSMTVNRAIMDAIEVTPRAVARLSLKAPYR